MKNIINEKETKMELKTLMKKKLSFIQIVHRQV